MPSNFVFGIHSPLQAMMLHASGHRAAWVGGYARSVADHALPDLDILSYTENLEAQQRILSAAPLRFIVDIDAGLASQRAQARYVRALDREKPFALCIEDEHIPKTSALYSSKASLLRTPEFVERVLLVAEQSKSRVWPRTNAVVRGVPVTAIHDRIRALSTDAGIEDLVLHGGDLDALAAVKAKWGGRLRLHLIASLCPPLRCDSEVFAGFESIILAHHLLFATAAFQEHYLSRIVAGEMLVGTCNHGKDLVNKLIGKR